MFPMEDIHLQSLSNFPKPAGHCSFLANVTQTGLNSASVGDYFQLWINTFLVGIRAAAGHCMCDQHKFNYIGCVNDGTCHPVQQGNSNMFSLMVSGQHWSCQAQRNKQR